MKDIRDTIDELAMLSAELGRDSCKALRAWSDICNGLTLRHLSLYEAKQRVDWAYKNIGQIKADIDEAVRLADEAIERGRAA